MAKKRWTAEDESKVVRVSHHVYRRRLDCGHGGARAYATEASSRPNRLLAGFRTTSASPPDSIR